MATIIAYLTGMAALLLAMKVFNGFERQAVEKPSRRWVIASDAAAGDDREMNDVRQESEPESAAAVESKGQNPAA